MFDDYTRLAERALCDEPPGEAEARWLLDGEDVALLPLLEAAYRPRERYFGRKVMVHILNNVQNGLCPEDCGYCSQSRDSESAIRKYGSESKWSLTDSFWPTPLTHSTPVCSPILVLVALLEIDETHRILEWHPLFHVLQRELRLAQSPGPGGRR